VLVSDIDAWKATTQPYSSSNEHYYATLETAEMVLPAGCQEDILIDMDYNYYLYSSDRGYMYADWYNEDGSLAESTTIATLSSSQSNSDVRYTVTPKSTRLRLRFVHDMNTYYYNGRWWSLDNLLVRTPTQASTCSEGAGTATWVGGDGEWTNTANWCEGRVPQETDDVILSCTSYSQVSLRLYNALSTFVGGKKSSTALAFAGHL
jgi:hypothetical protein